MKYETLFEEVRALPKGSITLRFVRHCSCKQTQWNSVDAKRLSDLSLEYFKKHGYYDLGCISYWVDIHNGGLAVKTEATNTKLHPNYAVQYRALLRRFAGKYARLRNEGSSSQTRFLPRGLLQSPNENDRLIRNEETSEFYVPLVPVRFISVPSSFYLTLDMSPDDRQRISSQLPEDGFVKIPTAPFPATKIEAVGVGERFIGLLSDEESVAFYMTIDKANNGNVISPQPFTVYPPLSMQHIIEKVNRQVLQKYFNEGICETSQEDAFLQLEFRLDLLPSAKRQNPTSSRAPVTQTTLGSSPTSLVETKAGQNSKQTSTMPEFKGLRHFIAYFGTGLSTIANPLRAFEPTVRYSHQLSFRKESEIEIYRPLLLSKDFASHSGRIWILAFREEDRQEANVVAKFYFKLPVYSSSVYVHSVYFTSAFMLSFEDLLSIKAILTPECFPMSLTLSHTKMDNRSTQINTLVRSIMYILVSSNVGSKVPLSPEERRILGYKSTDLLKSIEYYTVHPATALTWASIFYHEIGLSPFCGGKTKINENLTIFQHLSHDCRCRNLFLSGEITGENCRNGKTLNALLRPLCPSSCNQRIGAVPPPIMERFIVVKLPYKGRLGLNTRSGHLQSTRSGIESAPTDSLQKTPYWVNSRLSIQRP